MTEAPRRELPSTAWRIIAKLAANNQCRSMFPGVSG